MRPSLSTGLMNLRSLIFGMVSGGGLGLSSECHDKADSLRVAIEDYRAHLVSCKNSNCRAIAKNEIEACDKAIKELNEFKDFVSICAAINKLALILCGM